MIQSLLYRAALLLLLDETTSVLSARQLVALLRCVNTLWATLWSIMAKSLNSDYLWALGFRVLVLRSGRLLGWRLGLGGLGVLLCTLGFEIEVLLGAALAFATTATRILRTSHGPPPSTSPAGSCRSRARESPQGGARTPTHG